MEQRLGQGEWKTGIQADGHYRSRNKQQLPDGLFPKKTLHMATTPAASGNQSTHVHYLHEEGKKWEKEKYVNYYIKMIMNMRKTEWRQPWWNCVTKLTNSNHKEGRYKSRSNYRLRGQMDPYTQPCSSGNSGKADESYGRGDDLQCFKNPAQPVNFEMHKKLAFNKGIKQNLKEK